MTKNLNSRPSQEMEWPSAYLKMFTPLIIVVMITIVVDAWVEFTAGGLSPFFYKDLVTVSLIGFSYAMYGLKYWSKVTVINITVYSIIIGIMILLPFRLEIADFHFETYFLKVEIILIILTYAIGILVHPRHILYLLALNLIFIGFCIYGMYGAYPVSKFVFYIMLMTCTSLLGYRLNRIFYDLNQQISEANDVIQNQNEDLTRANAAKDQLFEILGHDLKAPFFHLSALLTLLNMTEDQEKKAEYMQLMKNAIKDGDDLVASILNWVDVQSTYLNFELEKLPIRNVLEKALEVKEPNAIIKSIKIETSIPDDLQMNMDPRMMETIFRNLICNSIKFSDRESRIQVTGEQIGEEVVVKVVDDGIGMSEDIKNELFKFGKIPTRLGTEDESGSGFGLNICKKMVENQKGELEITSETNKGTTITMTFPLPTG
jgi:two-component system, sensor histidine kinase and response regulator